jgi:putative ATPase
MRGSDADAAVYWLARMLHGGEDPKFIARRILIFASEDVGNADPQALLVAHAAFKAAESIGLPECRINLAQAATYMALAPKSNAAISAIDAALEEVRNGHARLIPNHLRDRHRAGSEKYGEQFRIRMQARARGSSSGISRRSEYGRLLPASPRGWEASRQCELEALRAASQWRRRRGRKHGVRRGPRC